MLTLDLTAISTLPTQRLVLREVCTADAQALFAMRSDADVMQFVHRPMAVTIDDAHALIAKIKDIQLANEGAQWAITLKGDDTFIGLIGLWRIMREHHRAELGYTLSRAHWGQGLMSEAIAAVIAHGFNVFKLHGVEAWTEPRNVGSVRTLEKNGFVREAYFKENIFWGGKFCDTVVYSRLAK